MSKTPADSPFSVLEKSLLRVSDLLSCAVATACKSNERRGGAKRDLTVSTLHLIDMAQTELKRARQCLKAR